MQTVVISINLPAADVLKAARLALEAKAGDEKNDESKESKVPESRYGKEIVEIELN